MFSVGSYAKVWEIKRIEDKYSDIRISTSAKNKDGDYEQDFGGFVRLVSKAHKAVSYLAEGDSFKILSCGVTNKYDKEKKVTYTNYTIFDLELQESDGKAPEEDKNPFL